MADLRNANPSRSESGALYMLSVLTNAAQQACNELQSSLTALATSLETCPEAGTSPRIAYERAMRAARPAVTSLQEIEAALGKRHALISAHVKDAEELTFTLALLNDQGELNATHGSFARLLSAANDRMADARNGALRSVNTDPFVARYPGSRDPCAHLPAQQPISRHAKPART